MSRYKAIISALPYHAGGHPFVAGGQMRQVSQDPDADRASKGSCPVPARAPAARSPRAEACATRSRTSPLRVGTTASPRSITATRKPHTSRPLCRFIMPVSLECLSGRTIHPHNSFDADYRSPQHFSYKSQSPTGLHRLQLARSLPSLPAAQARAADRSPQPCPIREFADRGPFWLWNFGPRLVYATANRNARG